MIAIIIFSILVLCLNGYAIYYALFKDIDGLGGYVVIFFGFLGFVPTIFCYALLITKWKTLSKKIKILGLISVLSIFFIPISIYHRDYLDCINRKSHITNRMDSITQNIQSWYFNADTKKFYLLKEYGYQFSSKDIPANGDFDQTVVPMSCRKWLKK